MVRYHKQIALTGVLIVTALGVGLGVWHSARARPMHVTVHVSGAPGTRVSGTFEVDGAPQAPEEAEVPAQFMRTGHKLAFTVLRVNGPEQPISTAVDLDGVRRGTGTAAGGVRVDIWSGDREPRFLAVPSEPEWKETEEAGPRPDLIGTRASEWTPVEWLNTEPLRLADLRGQVVLVRWFTQPICEDCVASAPALREFHERYRDLGLAVVGMYHHSDDTLEEVRKIVGGYGYRFPIGIDRGAKTRRLWCLGRHDYGYTSATFLLDRHGAIRYIHPGGRYVKGDADFQMLEAQIEQWLAR